MEEVYKSYLINRGGTDVRAVSQFLRNLWRSTTVLHRIFLWNFRKVLYREWIICKNRWNKSQNNWLEFPLFLNIQRNFWKFSGEKWTLGIYDRFHGHETDQYSARKPHRQRHQKSRHKQLKIYLKNLDKLVYQKIKQQKKSGSDSIDFSRYF